MIAQAGITPLDFGEPQDPTAVALGKALFFDKELSGSRDISCATCHHPQHSSHDDLSLSIGVGGTGLGPDRELGEARPLIPRNAPEIFNRGAADVHTMFWDGRVEVRPDGSIESPADEELPEGLNNLVAVQAMFPVTSRAEMRGRSGDQDVNGNLNEIAALSDEDFTEIWDAVMKRILAIPEYVTWFNEVYPEIATEELHYVQAANALAAFQIDAFSFDDSPWDQYVAGDMSSLSPEAKQGAILFYGTAGCATCHGGNLLTDQQYYNILAPQIGPGHRESAGYDVGRARVTDETENAFQFRTPALRNVALSGPWMHNGAYRSLEDVIRHHADPLGMLQSFDTDELTQGLEGSVRNDLATIVLMSETLSPEIEAVPELTDGEIDYLIAFLSALTSAESQDLSYLVPESVPSGLPVDVSRGDGY